MLTVAHFSTSPRKKSKHAKQAQNAGAVADYLQNLKSAPEARAGYYQRGQGYSQWMGAGAARLGLSGVVERDQLISAMNGRLDMISEVGEDITGRGNRSDRKFGADLHLAPPKSFSLALLSGGDERLRKVWREATQIAVHILENEVAVSRRGKGGKETEYTGSMLIAAHEHEEDREVEGQAAPQLHTHLFACNATQRADGHWAALELAFGEEMKLAKIVDFSVKAHLARRVQELGYSIRRTEDGFELDGISREVINAASPRSSQVEEQLERWGLSRADSTHEQRNAANLSTRGTKSTLSCDEQRRDWLENSWERYGMDFQSCREDAERRAAAGRAQPPEDLASASVRSALRHLTERSLIIGRSDLRLAALRSGMGNVSIHSVDEAINQGVGGLLDAGQDNHGRAQYTTEYALRREQETLHLARAGRQKARPIMATANISSFIRRMEQEQGFDFRRQQGEALEMMLTSRDSVAGVIGAAGVGKTTSMSAFVTACQEAGHDVVGLAPTTKAKKELTQAGCEVRTLAGHLAKSSEEVRDARIYLVDEAGMVGAEDMHKLLLRARKEGARVFMVGDPGQLRSVSAGTPFAHLLRRGAIAHAEITEIIRQRDPNLRAMVQAFADRNAARAVEKMAPYIAEVEVSSDDYTAAGYSAAEEDIPMQVKRQLRQQAIARATADEYLSLTSEDRHETIVVSPTNAVRTKVNDAIREGLSRQGQIRKEEIAIVAADKLTRLTPEQKTHAERYREGWLIRVREGKGKNLRDMDYRVISNDGKALTVKSIDGSISRRLDPAVEAERIRVYEERRMSLAEGDQIIVREAIGKGKDQIANGDQGRVVSVDKKNGMAVVQIDDGRSLEVGPGSAHVIDYSYCVTVHASQGASYRGAIMAGEAGQKAMAELGYVGMSRCKEWLKVITDDAEKFGAACKRYAEFEFAGDKAVAAVATEQTIEALRRKAAQELGPVGELATVRDEIHTHERGVGHESGEDEEIEF